ncbi:MAG: SDR family NAD(P)-dependent oxidoreductase [Nocardioides sp.]
MGELGYDYSGCHVVVTGGTEGAGLRIAQGFRDFGAAVTVTGRHYLTSYYDADLGHFGYVQLDLTDPDSIVRVAEGLGRVDVLVNSAGWEISNNQELDREFIVQATRLGLIGPVQLATRLRFRIAESNIRGGGSVIYAPGTQEWFSVTHHESASAELTKLTKQLGKSWARHRVRVNAIAAPARVPVQSRGVRVQIDAHSGPLLTRVNPPSTQVEPEVTDLVLFLASRGASALTGQTLVVGGPG